MLKTDVINHIVSKLYDAEKNSEEIDKFTSEYPELDISLAYDIQDRLIEKKCKEENTRISGRKLGLTSKAKQQMMGVHEPSYGVLLENMELTEGERVSIQPFIHAKVEPEIAFIFDKEVRGEAI